MVSHCPQLHWQNMEHWHTPQSCLWLTTCVKWHTLQSPKWWTICDFDGHMSHQIDWHKFWLDMSSNADSWYNRQQMTHNDYPLVIKVTDIWGNDSPFCHSGDWQYWHNDWHMSNIVIGQGLTFDWPCPAHHSVEKCIISEGHQIISKGLTSIDWLFWAWYFVGCWSCAEQV